MTVFISGGCKNGKSMFAQRVAVKLADGGKLYYVATMIPYDEEDRARVRRHVSEREGWGFETIECGLDILNVLETADENSTLLMDSVTALLLNEMFHGDFTKTGDKSAGEKCARELTELMRRVKNIVFVSDFLYSDAAIYDEFTDTYMQALAHVDSTIAKEADTVVEICAAGRYYHKGGEIL